MIQGHINLPLDMRFDCLNWRDCSQCYQQTIETQHYYNQHNSSIWQMFNESPSWVHDLAKLVPQDFDNHVVSLIRIDPGQTVPWHQDKHYILQKQFGAGDTWRYLIFLEDWKSGHYFEIEKVPVIKWRAGDYVKFQRKDWHLGGNMGLEPFYSAQITVI